MTLNPTGAAPLPMNVTMVFTQGLVLPVVISSGFTSTWLAIAQMNPTHSRATATTPWLAFLPLAMSCRERLPKRTWAFQLRSCETEWNLDSG